MAGVTATSDSSPRRASAPTPGLVASTRDTGGVAKRVTSTTFIGREAELAELRSALADAAAGNPSLAFVAGESGVGKTRMLGEFHRRAREDGARVIGGDSVELGEGELPYGAIVAAMRPLVRDGDPAFDDIPEAARAELATLLTDLGPAEPAEPDDERGASQGRLFEALLGLLDRLSRDAPVVFSLEDIHWADRSTRAFIAFLAGSLCDERVLAVATYRSDELNRRHPLRPLLAELERDGRTRRLELASLGRDELAVLVEDITGERPAAVVDRVYGRSEGNPLFAEELLAADSGGHAALPPTLRDALMVRVERLPADAQEVLRLLAAAGRSDHALLADTSSLEPRALREALREAVNDHIVVADAEARYIFRHALLREVVYDDLLPGERAELHLELARALERRAAEAGGGAWITAGIAHHYQAAGDQPAALRASVQAAEEADRVHAHGEEAALLERALELWDRVPDPQALAGVSQVELLLRAARAHRGLPDDSRAMPLFEQAIEGLDAEADPLRFAGVLGELASAQWSLGRGEESRATLDRALALVPDDPPTHERAKLLSEHVRFLMLRGRFRESIDAAREALPVADAAGAKAVRARILNRLGTALFASGQPEQGAEALHHAIELARERGTEDDLATTYVNFADALNYSGRGREAYDTARAAQLEIKPGNRSSRWLALGLSEFAFDLGEWELSEEQLGTRIARESGATQMNARLRALELALGRGDQARARTLLDDSAAFLARSVEPQYISPAAALRAELERRAGDIDAARTAVDEGIDRIEFCSEDLLRLAQVSAAGVAVEADAAERARDRGDADEEREALARAEAFLERVRAAAAEHAPVPDAYLAEAEAEAARAAGESDPELWATAIAAWEALERPYPAAIARWRRAEALIAAGDRQSAAEVAKDALDVARRLGSEWLAAEVDQLAARGRISLEPAAAATNGDAASDGDGADPFGLTTRERQVLVLLSRGATNRQIGEELYMAEKTASVHVSRILAKLGVRRRTEAAAVAHRNGLDGD
jgi:DNA-binding CsgD family transcriptional regulator/tetratricopeptide (TPR) repeat protein